MVAELALGRVVEVKFSRGSRVAFVSIAVSGPRRYSRLPNKFPLSLQKNRHLSDSNTRGQSPTAGSYK